MPCMIEKTTQVVTMAAQKAGMTPPPPALDAPKTEMINALYGVNGADRDKLMIGGSVLATSLAGYLALLAEVLTSASYPKRDVQDERGRVAEHLVVAGSSAGTAAAKAIAARVAAKAAKPEPIV